MIEKTEEDKIRELAASQLVAFMRSFQIASLRLRCAEIIWTSGSQEHRAKIEEHAERLYQFATKTGNEKND